MRAFFFLNLFLLLLATLPSSSNAFQLTTNLQRQVFSTIKLHATNLFQEDEHQPSSPDLSRREAWQYAAAMTTTASGLALPRSARAAQESTAEASTSKLAPVPTVRLGRSSLEVSKTIQGHWQLSGGHGKIREPDALANMDAHFKAGITTLDTADIYGPSELIVGKYVTGNPQAVPLTKFCCFRYLEEITKEEVRQRVEKVGSRIESGDMTY